MMGRWRAASSTPESSLRARLAIMGATVVADLALAIFAGAGLTALTCLAVVAAGHWRSWRGRKLRRTARGQALLGLLLAMCVAYLISDLFLGVFGGALPQAKFALLTQAVTSFDLKSRRNLFTHLWHSLVILYVAALFAWNIYFLPLVLLWAVCLFLFLAFSDGGQDEGDFRVVAGRLRRGAMASVPWVAAWLILSAVTFAALPRFAGRPVAVPLLVSIPGEDHSAEVLPAVLPLVGTAPSNSAEPTVSLRVRGRLGDEVVMRVRAPAASYWRTYVMDGYEHQAWRRQSRPARPIPPVATALTASDEGPAGIATLPQTYFIERPMSVEIPVSYPATELYFPATQLTLLSTGTIKSPYSLRKGVTYAAVSQVRDTSPDHLRLAGPIDPVEDALDVALPPGMPPRVKALADRLVVGKETEYDQVQAIAGYLRENYAYSLDTPRLQSGADAVDQFLFSDHVGFCEQFASALAVLLREEGIPARFAVGYSSGDHDSLTGSFTVRAHDAHAWVEVLFPGTGWVPFDASPGFDASAHVPARWFLSDVNFGLRLGGMASTPAGPTIPALGLLVTCATVVTLAWRRRSGLVPELRAYATAQRYLALSGLPQRLPAQTPAEHAGQVAALAPSVGTALLPLVESLQARLYKSPGSRLARPRLGPLRREALRFRLGRVR